MRVLTRLAVLFYMTTIMFLGCLTILFVLNRIPFFDMMDIFYLAYFEPNTRALVGILAVLLLAVNYIFAKSISGTSQVGSTIAFDNPSGRVSVSLSALEDLIKRVISRVSEVKEVRSSIRAGKKGLEVSSRIVLNADVNIPEMTSRLQELVKRKIHDTIGIEETVIVRIHVDKIIPSGKGMPRRKEKDDDEQAPEPTVPFQGYRA